MGLIYLLPSAVLNQFHLVPCHQHLLGDSCPQILDSLIAVDINIKVRIVDSWKHVADVEAKVWPSC